MDFSCGATHQILREIIKSWRICDSTCGHGRKNISILTVTHGEDGIFSPPEPGSKLSPPGTAATHWPRAGRDIG